VMLREKDLGTDDLVALGREVRQVCSRHGVPFLVNHDLDAARRLDADGVHLGYRSARPGAARRLLGPGFRIGASTHDAEELARALAAGVDYVTFGPVYDTASKRGLLEPRGPALLARAVEQAAPVPVLALGGVVAPRVAEVRAAGVAGIACIGAVLDADDPEVAARELVRAWDDAAGTRP